MAAAPGPVCYVTKLGEADGAAPLGFGVNVENARLVTCSSPCEHLSLEAFEGGVRASTTNKPFTHWVPVVTAGTKWPAIRGLWAERVERLAAAHPQLGAGGASRAVMGVRLCCSVMNSLVVEIMNARDQLTANDKFIEGYFAFYRVMKEVRREAAREVGAYADGAIGAFLARPEARRKGAVANLGEWLLLLLASERYAWGDVAEAFVAECDARNVFWYVQGTGASPGALPALAARARVAGRSVAVFGATPVSRSIVCYQVRFLRLAESVDFKAVDAAGGSVGEAVKQEIKGMHAAIARMRSWNEHFAWLGMAERSEAARDAELVAALDASAAAGYHGGSSGGSGSGGRGGYGRGGRGGRGW